MPPRVRDLAALEDYMFDRSLGETAADSEPRMAGADDDNIDGAGERLLRTRRAPRHATSMVTFVGFVTMS